MHSVITRDPDTGWVNVGTYRMMLHNGQETGIQIDPANQHIGQHYWKYIERNEPMPAAIVIGQEPALTFMAASPTLDPVSELDIAGAIRGAPIDVVKCETSDLYVPANAEIVLEGTIHPKERKLEGPGPEYADYYANQPGMKPVFRCKAVTFRDDPIFRATPEGHPINEDHMMLAINTSVYVTDALARAGVPGVREVAMPLDACGYGICVVSIKPATEGHAGGEGLPGPGAHRPEAPISLGAAGHLGRRRRRQGHPAQVPADERAALGHGPARQPALERVRHPADQPLHRKAGGDLQALVGGRGDHRRPRSHDHAVASGSPR